MKLMAIFLTGVGLFLAGCGGSGDDSSSNSAPKENQNYTDNTDNNDTQQSSGPLCFQILECEQQCFIAFPFRSEEEIGAEASAGGWLNSGRYIKEIERNRASYENYTKCLETPAEGIIG